jgi:hypothetical protein
MCGNALLDAPFIGRAKNFFIDGDTARADLFLRNSAKETPAGNLYGRVISMAEEDPEMFGMSIVFSPSESYRIDVDGNKFAESTPEFHQLTGDPFATIDKLFGVDVVDEGAATDGLFGAVTTAEFATIATDFLDNNERLWDLIDENPEVVNQFMSRYRSRCERINQNKEQSMPEDQKMPEAEETEPVELESGKQTETETFAAEPAEVVEVTEQPVGFKELYDAYGPAFAEYAFDEKLTAGEAKDAYCAHLQDRVADLEMQLSEVHEREEGEDPAEFTAVAEEEDTSKALSKARADELAKAGISPARARYAASLNINK